MVTITEGVLPSGWRSVVLEHETLRATLLPDKGAEIHSLEWLPLQLDLLWKAPWGLRPPAAARGSALSATAWLDAYGGGWQELFPNAGDACVYRGAALGFHGEASVAPWQYAIQAGPDGAPEVALGLRCACLPFRLEKRVSLDPARPVLRLQERVTNEGGESLPFMWGHHPAYGAPFLQEGCRLDLPAASFEADAQQEVGFTWLAPGQRSAWPAVARVGGGTVDLRRMPGPEASVANLGYALDLREGWYALVNPNLGVGVGMVWPRQVFPSVWLWQEFRGTRGHPWDGNGYVLGVEPHTSIPGHGLVQALERGSARWLAPGEQLEVQLRTVLFEDGGPVRHISPDGRVEYAGG